MNIQTAKLNVAASDACGSFGITKVTDSIGSSTQRLQANSDAGGMAMKRRWKPAANRLGKSTEKPKLVTGPVQVCWHNLRRYWDVDLPEIPMQEGPP